MFQFDPFLRRKHRNICKFQVNDNLKCQAIFLELTSNWFALIIHLFGGYFLKFFSLFLLQDWTHQTKRQLCHFE